MIGFPILADAISYRIIHNGSIWPEQACARPVRPREIRALLTDQKRQNIINPNLPSQTASGRLRIGMHGRLGRNT